MSSQIETSLPLSLSLSLEPLASDADTFAGNALYAYRLAKLALLSSDVKTAAQAESAAISAEHRAERADALRWYR